MSMPIIAAPDNPVTREQAVNDLIESVAMMEAGMSHVINAEGEKIQKVVDPDADYPLEDIINVNNSAEKMINTMSKLEMMLQSKLEATKEFDTGTTPGPGPTPAPGVTAFALSANNMEGTTYNFTAIDEIQTIALSTVLYSNGFTADADNENFTVQNTGSYLIDYAFLADAETNSTYELSIYINDVAVATTTKMLYGNMTTDLTINAILELAQNDVLSLKLKNLTFPGTVQLDTRVGASLTAVRIA